MSHGSEKTGRPPIRLGRAAEKLFLLLGPAETFLPHLHQRIGWFQWVGPMVGHDGSSEWLVIMVS